MYALLSLVIVTSPDDASADITADGAAGGGGAAGGADAYSYSEGSEEGEAGPPPADLDAANAYDYYSGDEAEEGA